MRKKKSIGKALIFPDDNGAMTYSYCGDITVSRYPRKKKVEMYVPDDEKYKDLPCVFLLSANWERETFLEWANHFKSVCSLADTEKAVQNLYRSIDDAKKRKEDPSDGEKVKV